jgi:hypothetical protein
MSVDEITVIGLMLGIVLLINPNAFDAVPSVQTLNSECQK